MLSLRDYLFNFNLLKGLILDFFESTIVITPISCLMEMVLKNPQKFQYDEDECYHDQCVNPSASFREVWNYSATKST